MNSILENKHLKADPFVVPDDYFEQFSSRMMNLIPETEVQPARIIPLGQRIRAEVGRVIGFAAMITLVVLFSRSFKAEAAASTPYVQSVSSAVVVNSDVETDNAYDYMLLDNVDIIENP